MRDEGLIEALSRGVYLSALPLPAYPDIAAVFMRAPRAVLWMALPAGVTVPKIAYPRIERFSMSQESLSAVPSGKTS
jgi:hypothetical protein